MAANSDPQNELVRSTAKALLDHVENTGRTYLTEMEIAEPSAILAALVGGLENLQPVLDHAVPWNFAAWKAGFGFAEGLEDDTREALVKAASALQDLHDSSIARRDVFDFVNSQDRSEIDGFLAMMAWGHGTTGYGWWRTAKAAASLSGNQYRKLRHRIRAQVEAARDPPNRPSTPGATRTRGSGSSAQRSPANSPISQCRMMGLVTADSSSPMTTRRGHFGRLATSPIREPVATNMSPISGCSPVGPRPPNSDPTPSNEVCSSLDPM